MPTHFNHAGRWGAVFIAVLAGCGLIADQDRIIVAMLDGKPIRYGQLVQAIRELPDDERPLIQNKGDLLRALNKYIDDEIKKQLASELRAQNKIRPQRDLARQVYLRKNPDNAIVYQVVDPAVLEITQAEFDALKVAVEFGIDREEENLLREQALVYAAQDALRFGALTISEEEYQQEYDVRKNELLNRERIEFKAIVFPQGAVGEAADVRRRIQSGERFEDVAAEFERKDPSTILITALENDPASERFRSFWMEASGSRAGDVLGPIALPAHEQSIVMDGRESVVSVPASVLVLQVISHEPVTPKTLEQAKPELTSAVALRKMMEELRRRHAVQVFPDKLPDPAGFGDQYKDYIIRQQ